MRAVPGLAATRRGTSDSSSATCSAIQCRPSALASSAAWPDHLAATRRSTSGSSSINCSAIHLQATAAGARHRSAWRPQASSTIGTCRPPAWPARPHALATWRQPGAPPAAAARPAAARSTCRPARLVAAIGRPGARTRQLDHRHRQTTSCCSSTACPDHLAATRCTTSDSSSASRSAIHVQAVGAGQRGRMARPPGSNQVHHQLLQRDQPQRDPPAGRRGWWPPSVDQVHAQPTGWPHGAAPAAAARPHADRQRWPARPHGPTTWRQPGAPPATAARPAAARSTCRPPRLVHAIGRPGAHRPARPSAPADHQLLQLGRMARPPGGNQVHHQRQQLGQPQRDPPADRRSWWPPSVDQVHAQPTGWPHGAAPAAAARSTAARSTCRPPRLVHAIGRPGAHRPARPSAPADHQPGQRGRMPWPPGGNQVHHQLLQLDQPQRDPRAGRRGWWPPSVDRVHAHASSTIGTGRPPAAAARPHALTTWQQPGAPPATAARPAAARSTCRPSAPASAAAWPDHLAATRCTTSCCSAISRSVIHLQAGAAGGHHRSTRCTHSPPGGRTAQHQRQQLGHMQTASAGQRGRMARPPGGNQVHHQRQQLGQPQRDPHAGHRGWCTPSVGLAPTGQLDHRHLQTTSCCSSAAWPDHLAATRCTTSDSSSASRSAIHLQTGAAGGHHRSTRCTRSPQVGRTAQHQRQQLDQLQRDPPAGHRGWCTPSVGLAPTGQLDHRHLQTTSLASAAACPGHLAATRCTTSCCSSTSRSAIHVQTVGADRRGRMAWPPGGNQVHHELLQLGQPQRDPRAGRRGWWPPSVDRVHAHASSTIGTCRPPAAAARPHALTTWQQPGSAPAAAARSTAARSTCRPPRLVHAIGRPGAHRPARPSAPADHQPGQRGRMP